MLTIKEAAERAGLNPDTLRAWERRYGVVQPERTAAGYRLYSDADIERLLAMQSLIDEGFKPRVAAEYLNRNGLPDGASGKSSASAPGPQQAVGPAPARARSLALRSPTPLVVAAARLDVPGMASYFDELRALGTFETVCEEHLFPALRELGETWANGRVSVAGEHAASAAALRWLNAQYQAAARDTHPPQVLVGLPSGVHHALGALAHAVALRRAGIAVLFLGPDLPEDEWRVAARKTGARVAVVGVPTAKDVAAARRVAAAFEQSSPGVRLAFGGRGAERLAADGVVLPVGMVAAVAAVREALEGVRVARPGGSMKPSIS